MLKIMVVGATSAIAHEAARCFAQDGAELYLVARNEEKLQVNVDDLLAFGAKRVETCIMDMNDNTRHADLLNSAQAALGGLDALIVCYGTLGDQPGSEGSVDVMMRELQTNFLSTASLLTHAANIFEKQRRGVIAVVSSVAGDRGRGSNYVYGTAMGAKSLFLSGLRNRLAKSGVQVVTVKPGFTDTPMTADFKKGALWASAEQVGQDIYKGMKNGRDVIYTPFFWRYIMWIIRLIPEPIFKRLSL